tara:strand:+ start:171 stop:734 length:564 start_codon:yes stop_codon:yes gene_type:complete
MGDPVTMMLITTAASSVMGGIQAKAAGKANQAMAEHNAANSRNRAKEAQNKAAFDAARLRERGRGVLSSQRTAYNKAGVEVEGSPLEVLGDTAANIELDAALAHYGGEMDARAHLSNAAAQQYEGRISAWKGKQAFNAGLVTAGGSMLGAAYTGGMFDSVGAAQGPGYGGRTSSVYGGYTPTVSGYR